MTKTGIKALIDKYQNGNASAEERGLLESWYNQDVRQRNEMDFPEDLWQRQEESLKMILGKEKTRSLWPRIVAIAAAVAAIVFGIWFFTGEREVLKQVQDDVAVNDIAPGKNGATLTLSTGEVITLDGTKNGVIIGDELKYSDGEILKQVQDDVHIQDDVHPQDDVHTQDDAIARHPELVSGSRTNDAKYTAATAKGQTYMVILPDGSKVWLNAASTLKFPSSFSRKVSRTVELAGEAYFEISKNKSQAFVVKTKKGDRFPEQEIKVLGTHFNVSAYEDEATVRTTLLEGSVDVGSVGVGRSRLKPEQQAVLSRNGIKVQAVRAEDAIAWKEGLFIFEDEPLEQIMRRIARWYNVEVVYDDGVDRSKRYWGSVSRYEQVSGVLDIMQSTRNIHFKVEGRRIRVMK
ncbi:FecR family protein [Pedobacter sp. GR22-6]|uniref:FecR family protein n=1 Tax=Pedobacter sp. GR22-6 TaxID=3127957 RepID=UPI00307D03CF